MREIQSAEFIKGATEPSGVPRDLRPHIVFAGRSNVGKSSLLNTLTGRKSLARSSSKPGKTTEINFFLINKNRYFVDLPGYGYAKQPGHVRELIERMISEYLFHERMPVTYVVLLVDAIVGPTQLDLELFEELRHHYKPEAMLVVLNKIDKVPKSKRSHVVKGLSDQYKGTTVIPFSSKERIGRKELLSVLLS